MSASVRLRIPLLLLLLAFVPFFGALTRFEVFQFRDHYDYFLPLHYFTTQRLTSGDLPLWNPYNAAGERWLANPQTGVFYPPGVLFLLLPFPTAYVLFLALHVALLGVGAFLLFRRWSSAPASFFGATALMLSGPVLSLLDVSNNLSSLAWFPLVIWCALERTKESPTVPALAGGAALAMTFLGGEPFLAALAALIFVVVIVSGRKGRSLPEVGPAALAALGLSAVQLLPFLDMLRGSDRLSGLDRGLALQQSLSLSDWTAVVVRSDLSRLGLIIGSQTFIASLFVGGVTVFFALAGMLTDRQDVRQAKRGWLALLISVMVLAAGSQLSAVASLTMVLHLNVSRYPSRLVPIGVLALCALASIGLSSLAAMEIRRRVIAAAVTLAIVTAGFLRFQSQMDLSAGAVLSILFLLTVVLAVTLASALTARVSVVMAITLLVACESILSSRAFFLSAPFTASVQPWARVISTERRLARIPSSDRIALASRIALDRTAWYSGYLNLYDRKYDLSTASPVISSSYARLHDAALFEPRLDLLDFLSVGYLISDRSIHQPALHPFFRLRSVGVYLNEASGPMATLWHRWIPVADEKAARSNLFSGAFDASRQVILWPAAPGTNEHALTAAEEIRIEPSADEDELRMTVDTKSQALLVVNQVGTKGWRLFIDGRENEVLHADAMFLAAMIPEGRHQVLWRYQPRFIFFGMVISLLAFGWSTFLTIKFLRRAAWRANREGVHAPLAPENR